MRETERTSQTQYRKPEDIIENVCNHMCSRLGNGLSDNIPT